MPEARGCETGNIPGIRHYSKGVDTIRVVLGRAASPGCAEAATPGFGIEPLTG